MSKQTDKTNLKDALGSMKLPLALWPTTASAIGSLGILEGKVKYGLVNWRATPVRISIYLDALQRHIDAYREGEETAPDSEVPHLGNALACIAIIVDAKTNGTLIDDRPFSNQGYRKLIDKLTPLVREISNQYKDKKPHHFTIQDKENLSG